MHSGGGAVSWGGVGERSRVGCCVVSGYGVQVSPVVVVGLPWESGSQGGCSFLTGGTGAATSAGSMLAGEVGIGGNDRDESHGCGERPTV